MHTHIQHTHTHAYTHYVCVSVCACVRACVCLCVHQPLHPTQVRSEWSESSVRHVWPRCAWGDVTYSNPSEALKVMEAVDAICRCHKRALK